MTLRLTLVGVVLSSAFALTHRHELAS
uniref:Uncharacterized protein n=1 Tax=Anguilla anguilla TaxID=7936 RepID=A0A0E9TJP2_ANGAN